jgi:hypothetical protein
LIDNPPQLILETHRSLSSTLDAKQPKQNKEIRKKATDAPLTLWHIVFGLQSFVLTLVQEKGLRIYETPGQPTYGHRRIAHQPLISNVFTLGFNQAWYLAVSQSTLDLMTRPLP